MHGLLRTIDRVGRAAMVDAGFAHHKTSQTHFTISIRDLFGEGDDQRIVTLYRAHTWRGHGVIVVLPTGVVVRANVARHLRRVVPGTMDAIAVEWCTSDHYVGNCWPVAPVPKTPEDPGTITVVEVNKRVDPIPTGLGFQHGRQAYMPGRTVYDVLLVPSNLTAARRLAEQAALGRWDGWQMLAQAFPRPTTPSTKLSGDDPEPVSVIPLGGGPAVVGYDYGPQGRCCAIHTPTVFADNQDPQCRRARGHTGDHVTRTDAAWSRPSGAPTPAPSTPEQLSITCGTLRTNDACIRPRGHPGSHCTSRHLTDAIRLGIAGKDTGMAPSWWHLRAHLAHFVRDLGVEAPPSVEFALRRPTGDQDAAQLSACVLAYYLDAFYRDAPERDPRGPR